MSVNFETELINLNELKKNEKSILLVEGDIIVPDVNPDISKILLADANASVISKDSQNGKINISGCLFVNILYAPENAEENMPKLKSINTKLDFHDSFSCSSENPSVSVKADVVSVNYNVVNSRKVNVKITVELNVKAYEKNQLPVITGVLENTQAETKMKSISIHSTAVDCQKQFVFAESLEVPAAKCDIEELLKTSVTITKGECKASNNNIALSGSVNVLTLYTGFEEGFIHECMEHELPFYENIEAEGLFDDCMCNVTYDIKEISANVTYDLNGDPRMIEISVTICANITASKIYDMNILEDLYYPGKLCTPKRETKRLRKNINEGTSRVSFKNNMMLADDAPLIVRVSNVTTRPVIRECENKGDKLVLRGDITAFLIYCADDGALNSETCEFAFEHVIDIDPANSDCLCEYNVCVTGTNFNILSEREVEIRTNVEFFVRMTEEFDEHMISDCTISEMPDDIKSMPQIIIYFVQNGDTLWDIAKHYNTTIKRIKDANHIEELSAPREKILIPAR